MIHIQEVNLVPFGLIVPAGQVGVVMLQPYLKLTQPEPYRCQEDARPEQLNAIRRTLQIARLADHGAGVTHFTLFPEYSIPGLDGISLIESALNDDDWPRNTVVIAGTDALDIAAYTELCAAAATSVDHERNGPDKVPAGQWINCCIIWVKAGNGEVRRWLQPKLAPAWLEQHVEHQSMYRGKSVFSFKCAFSNNAECRFFSLVCYDWIAHIEGEKILHQILRQLTGQLNWTFVIQRNINPSDADTFLTEVNEFFINPNLFPNVRREHACLIFANNAGAPAPGMASTYGQSCIILSPSASVSLGDTCHPTYTGKASRLRGTNMIDRCKDVLFRERGACIHSFSQRVPAFLALDAGDRTLPLPSAVVHSIVPGAPHDPRACGQHVPGCVKWVNDKLDTLPCISQRFQDPPLPPLVQQLPAAHSANKEAIRTLDSHQLDRRIADATCGASPHRNADFWDVTESDALENMIHTLDIMRIGFPNLDLASTAAHGTFTTGHQVVDVLAVKGESHVLCLTHATRVPRPVRHKLLLVSRDHLLRPILPKEGKVYSPSSTEPGGDPKITDVESGMTRIGFRDLLDFFERATTRQRLEDALNAKIAI